MYIEVIPLDTSIDASGLTYFVSEELHGSFGVGSLVEIPLRSSLSSAIVSKLSTEPSPEYLENIRSIVSVICGIPLLAPYQLETILFLADRHFVHAHKALSLFLSKSLVKYVEKKSFIQLVHTAPVFKKISTKPRFMHCGNTTDITEYIHKSIQDNTSLVVIFPDDFAIDGYLSRFPEDPATVLVVRDALTQTQKFKRFIDVYNGEKKIIIWTRKLLYYNLSHYTHLLYVEDALCRSLLRFEHRYSNMEALDHITSGGGFETSIISTIPSIESLYKSHTGQYIFSQSL